MPDKKIATGIYRTATGFRAFVRVRGHLQTSRWPKTATLTEMKGWRADRQHDGRRNAAPVAARGTLAADIDAYLEQVAAMPTITWRRRDLYAWREVYGDLARAKLTTLLIRAQLQAWRANGPTRRYIPRRGVYLTFNQPLSASACNHRRTALLHLYTVLDGRDAPNPVRAIRPFAEPPPEPRAKDLGFLAAAIERLRNKQQRARARVLLWTGMRGNSELGRMTREHVDLEGRVCHVPTGKGGKRFRLVPLNDAGIAAWKEFAAANAWGRYDKDALRKSFALACKREAQARNLPESRARVYDLRHSLATAYLRAGADLADVQELLGHTTTRMTRRYAPLQRDKLLAAAESIGRELKQGTS